MEIEGSRQTGCSRQMWRDCIKNYIKSFGLFHEDVSRHVDLPFVLHDTY